MISDTVLLAMIVGIPPTIASITAAIVSFRNSKKVDDNTAKTIEVSQKVDENAVKTAEAAILIDSTTKAAENTAKIANEKMDHVIVLTNSTLSAANARVAALEKLVETLMIERAALGKKEGSSELSKALDEVQEARGIEKVAANVDNLAKTVIPKDEVAARDAKVAADSLKTESSPVEISPEAAKKENETKAPEAAKKENETKEGK